MGRVKNYFDMVKRVRMKIPNCNYLSAILIPFDIHYWKKQYQLLESEYFFYDFLKKSKRQRLEYVRDYECMHNIPDTFNNSQEYRILEDKNLFNAFFSDSIGRGYVLIDSEQSYENFVAFAKKYPDFMCKPLNNLGGFGIRKISISNTNLEKIWNEILSQEPCILEEVLSQHTEMAALNPDTLNTIRVVSMVDEKGNINIPLANIRIGRNGAVVDNFCSGGMSASVDIKSGIVSSMAHTKQMESYSIHPDTQCPILGHQIPEWDKVLDIVRNSAQRLPTLRYIGWDVAIKKDGTVCLIEGNHNAGSDVHQVAAGKGLRSLYEECLGSWN